MLTASHAVLFYNTQTELEVIKQKLSDAVCFIKNISVEYEYDTFIFEDEWQETGYKNRSDVFVKLHSDATLQEYLQLTKMLMNTLEEGETENSLVLVDCVYKDEHIS